MDFGSAFTAIKTAVQITQEMNSLVEKYNDLNIKNMFLELNEKHHELRSGLLDAKEENLSLKEEISNLKKQISQKDDFVFRNNLYWKKKNDGSEEGPFCPRCFDSDKKEIRLMENKSNGIWDIDYKCINCKNDFKV